MMNCMVIKLKDPLLFDMKHGLDIIQQLRFQMIAHGDAVGLKDIFEHESMVQPRILYAQPHKHSVRIYGINEGVLALEAVAKTVEGSSALVFDGKRYAIEAVKHKPVAFLPRSAAGPVLYDFATTGLFFTNNSYRVWHAMEKEYGRGSPAFDEAVKKTTLNLIRGSIKAKLTSYLGERDYGFVDRIDLQWERFGYTFVDYHKDEGKTPGIYGRLRSNFHLPPFVGFKTGKGFGQLIERSEQP